MLQIGEVADRVGLSLRTVRYYEETGLLEPEARTDGGFRLYTHRHVQRLEVIKQLKPLGFNLHEMRELLDTHDRLHDPDADEGSRDAARERLAEYAEIAQKGCDRLREQLRRGEAFLNQLRRDSRRRRTTPARS